MDREEKAETSKHGIQIDVQRIRHFELELNRNSNNQNTS